MKKAATLEFNAASRKDSRIKLKRKPLLCESFRKASVNKKQFLNQNHNFGKTDFNHYYRIYWAFMQLCNDNCDHCYNSSGPFGTRISEKDCLPVVDNLPKGLGRLK